MSEKKDRVLQMKLLSVIFVWIAFVILYLLLGAGDSAGDTLTYVGLGIITVANIFLAASN